jgi:hypothetical protein
LADDSAKELRRRADRLFEAKKPFDSLCQEIALNFYSARADFRGELSLGDEFASHQVDAFPEMVRRDLGLAIGSMLRPADRIWFTPHVDDERVENDTQAQSWLEFGGKVLSRIISDRRAQFRRATSEGDHDFATFGQAVIACNYNKMRDGLAYRCFHLRDNAWAESEEGSIGQHYRKSVGPVGNVAQKFGESKLPMKWRELLNKDDQAKVTVYHAVLSAEDYRGAKKLRTPWASVYFTDTDDMLSEGGDTVMPYVVPRWATRSGCQYAFSPATIIALPQARLIQRMGLTLLEAAEKAVDPPLVAQHEVIKSDIDLSAGAITWTDRTYDERLGEAIRPMQLGKEPSFGVQLLEHQRELLKHAFYLDKISLPQERAKTAYETAQLVQEYVRNALPLFEPLEDEYNGQLLEITATRAFEAGAFGDPSTIPEALQGQKIAFKFTNPLRESLDKAKVVAFQEASQLLQAAMAFDPTSVADVDVTQMLRDAVRGTGAPSKWLRSEEDAQQIKAQQAQEAQGQQAMQQIDQGAQVAGNVGAAGSNVVDMLTRMGVDPAQLAQGAA